MCKKVITIPKFLNTEIGSFLYYADLVKKFGGKDNKRIKLKGLSSFILLSFSQNVCTVKHQLYSARLESHWR